MAFGQSSGPPAPHRQVERLLELLQNAGHADFRDARGPMGFNQRQGGGKFTADEAEAFIEQLENEEFIEGRDSAPAAAAPKLSKAELALRDVSDELLAAELQRRGWVVMEPS